MKKGTFQVTSGLLAISDPCYDGPSNIVDARNGEWEFTIEYSDEGTWGIRVESLEARFLGHYQTGRYGTLLDNGVDSGQMSIVDASKYKGDDRDNFTNDDDSWYWGTCCKTTLSETQGGEIPQGVVSSTGYGDGCYPASVLYDTEGRAVLVHIDFLSDEEEEEYYEDYDSMESEEDEGDPENYWAN